MFSLGILGRKENSASTEVHVLYLDPHKFTDATAEFINYFKHQFVFVIVNTVEKTLELIDGQITDDLAETFVPLGAFPFSARNLTVRIIIMVDLRSNVNSECYLSVCI